MSFYKNSLFCFWNKFLLRNFLGSSKNYQGALNFLLLRYLSSSFLIHSGSILMRCSRLVVLLLKLFFIRKLAQLGSHNPSLLLSVANRHLSSTWEDFVRKLKSLKDHFRSYHFFHFFLTLLLESIITCRSHFQVAIKLSRILKDARHAWAACISLCRISFFVSSNLKKLGLSFRTWTTDANPQKQFLKETF